MRNSNSISVTIPVKGKENLRSLSLCLASLDSQTMGEFEIILIGEENDLKDFEYDFKNKKLKLKKIYAKADKNEARNMGFSQSSGEYILFMDHDMRANKELLADCFNKSSKCGAIIIPERGAGGNFWANCRKLEKELISYDLDTVTPRFFRKELFSKNELPFDSKFGLLDEWGFNVKIKGKKIPIGISSGFLTVSDENISIDSQIKNKFLRGLWMKNFSNIDKDEAWRRINPIKRGLIFYTKRLPYLVSDPLHFSGLLVLKFMDLTFFFLGYLFAWMGFKESYPRDMVQTYDNYGNVGSEYLTQMYTQGRWNKYVDQAEKREVARLLRLNINEKVQGKKILDLGMGPGRWSKFFLEYKFKSVIGVDISADMVNFAKKDIKDKRFSVLLGDMSKLELPDNSFDKVFCFRALKYVPDYKGALGEMGRVLTRHGELLFEVPNKSLTNRILKFFSFFIISVNKSARDKTIWGYFNNVKFFSKDETYSLIKEYSDLKVKSITPLFILPSTKLPKSIDKFAVRIFIFCDNLLFRLLPKNIFTRSWIILAEKL